MRGKTRAIAAAGIVSLALVATACGSGTTASTKTIGALVVRGCTPQNELIPGNTGETCGGNIIDASFSKLVHYNSDTAKPEMDLAESIATTDSTVFTVKLKKGQKFSDGTEIKAKNFVDTWNYTALGTNGQQSSYFFTPIKGFADTQCGDADCKVAPKAEKLSGLAVVDDYTFTITTDSPTSNLVVRLGYSAFAPMPDAFFAAADKKAWAKSSLVSSGPYKVTTQDATAIVLERNTNYAGAYKGVPDKITFKIYNDDAAAYADTLANNLDLLDIIPSANLAGDIWKTDLKDRNGTKATGVIQYMGFSPIDTNWKSVDLKKAISMAVDRAAVIKAVFNGARVPATGWVSPVVDGYKANQCDACTFDVTKAKELYAKSGGYQGGPLTIWYNNDGGHKQWVDAVCNQIKNNLGLECVGSPTPKFKGMLDALKAKELKGLFRLGWQMDYPSIENFLAPIYGKGADSNYSEYDNPAFDKAMTDGAAAKTTEEANKIYQDAEAMLAKDQASIPTWYAQAQFGWSNKITSVKMTPFGTWDFTSIVLK
ncbi:MAG: ABC transporter substrate-binding protein [Propionibacteriaceae bacterium]|nr:ABC transporter substrate-binding protein [Micropruina sp.]HBX82415.1 peptide ABC transporter substrate-binding protein [Propionibacteriaceae bacterium]HBY21908.1 peptide ABC transporter substrate-binding protein [Propionibacteriaceae bacterium]